MADNWSLKAILSATDNMSPALKQIAASAKNTRKHLGDVGSAAGKAGGKVGLPVGIVSAALGGFSLMAVKNAVVGFAQLGEALHNSALRTGMTVEELQKMKYAADQAGVPVEALEGGVGKLNKNISAAAGGQNKNLAGLFKKLGIETRGANGELRTGTEMLPELADAFKRNTNPVTQARIGFAMFGKTWQQMIPMLAEGSEALGKSAERFKLLKGMGLDKDTVDGAVEFGKQLKDVDIVTKGFQNTIAKELVPVLRPLIEDFIQWGIANRKVVAAGVKDMVKDLIVWLKAIDWKGVIDGAKSFASGLGWMVDMIGGGKVALIALVVFLNSSAIMSFVALGGTVIKLAGFLSGPLASAAKFAWMIMSACPVLVIIAAVIMMASIIYQNWDAIAAYIGSAWDRVKDVFSVNFFDGIIQVYLEAWQGLANGILGIVKTILPDALLPDSVKNFKFSFATDRAAAIAASNPAAGANASAIAAGNPLVGPNAPALAAGNPLAGSMSSGSSGGRNLLGRADQPSLLGASSPKVGGEIKVSFQNAPPGMRVDPVSDGGVALNPNVGYREYAFD